MHVSSNNQLFRQQKSLTTKFRYGVVVRKRMLTATALTILILYGSTTHVVATLNGPNLCYRQETYNKTIQVIEQRPFKVRKYSWCLKVPPRCSVDRHEMREIVINRLEEDVRNITECCDGFVAVPITIDKEECKFSCIDMTQCVHGYCGDYNECLCNPGYQGDRCQQTCPMGRWGPNCSNPCHCTTCHYQTGLCYDTNATWRLTSPSTSTSTFSPLTLDPAATTTTTTTANTTTIEWDNNQLSIEELDYRTTEEEDKDVALIIKPEWQMTTDNETDLIELKNNYNDNLILPNNDDNEVKERNMQTSSTSIPVLASLAVPGLNDHSEVNNSSVPSASAPTQLVQRQPREILAGLAVALAVALAIIIVAVIILGITAKRFHDNEMNTISTTTSLNSTRNMASIVRKSMGGHSMEANNATATAVAITCKTAVATFDIPLPVRDLYFTPVLAPEPPIEEDIPFELAQLSLPPPHLLATARHSLPARNRASTDSHYDVPPSARASLPASPDRCAFEPIYDEIPGWRFANLPPTIENNPNVVENNNNMGDVRQQEIPPPLPAANGQRVTSFGAV